MKSYILLGFRNLSRRRSRSFLTALGVLLAVGFTVGLLSISEGFMKSIDSVLLGQGPELFVMAHGDSKMPFPMRGESPIAEDTYRIISGLPGVKMAEPVYQAFCVSEGAGTAVSMMGMPTMVIGLPPKGFFVMRPTAKVERGRWLRDGEKSVVLGGAISQNLKKDLGDNIELVSGEQLRVVGILRKDNAPYDFFSYAPLKMMQDMFNTRGQVSYVLVKLQQADDMNRVKAGVHKAFPKFDVQTVSDIADQARKMMSLARAVHVGVSCFALLIGVLFVACTMIMSVSERIREFAALRVIGASRGYIVKLILAESVTLSVIGGIMGCVFGLVLSHVINGMIYVFAGETFLRTLVSARIFATGIVIACLIGTVAAILPALMILRRNLAESLRYE
jgi:putative ABC transport system permease protein